MQIAAAAGILAGILVFLLGLRLGRGRAALPALACVLALLGAKALLHHRPDWEYGLFPWPGYLFWQGYLAFPLALACLGLAAGRLPAGRNRRALAGLAALVLVFSVWSLRWALVEADTTSIARAGPDHHCAQTTDYSCGAAACVSLLSRWGIDATEGEMVGLTRTPPWGGTTLYRLAHGLRRKLAGTPLHVRIVGGDLEELRAAGLPVLIAVRRSHVVALAFEDDLVVVHDPALPCPQRLPASQAPGRFDGPAVVVAPCAALESSAGGLRGEPDRPLAGGDRTLRARDA